MRNEIGGQECADVLLPVAASGEATKPISGISPAAPFCDDLRRVERQTTRVIAHGQPGHFDLDIQNYDAGLADTIAELREQWRRRQAWHRAEKSLTLQAKALCRRLVAGDKKEADRLYRAAIGKKGETHDLAGTALAAVFPLTEARDGVERHRKLVEKRLVLLAKELPVSGWVEGVRGFGMLSLAAIIGEAGDLSNYANPAKLWKRLGLAVMPDGMRQRRVTGNAAIEHGYNPARRSVVWSIGDAIIRAKGPMKAVYDERKVYEVTRVETKAHAHNRAKRYMEKRLIRDLWAAWRSAERDQFGAVIQPVSVSQG